VEPVSEVERAALARRRAETVRTALLNAGAPEQAVSVVSAGEGEAPGVTLELGVR
jgi:outer membrane protein OmpA-like peptidoglycan-associated protein